MGAIREIKGVELQRIVVTVDMMNGLPGLSRRGMQEATSSSASGRGVSGSLAPGAAAGSSVHVDLAMRSAETFDGGSTGYGNHPSRDSDSETLGDTGSTPFTDATHGDVAPTTVPAGDAIVHIVTGFGRRYHGLGDGTQETRAATTTTTGSHVPSTGIGFHGSRSGSTDVIRPVFASTTTTTSVPSQASTPPVSPCTRHAAAHPTHPSTAAYLSPGR